MRTKVIGAECLHCSLGTNSKEQILQGSGDLCDTDVKVGWGFLNSTTLTWWCDGLLNVSVKNVCCQLGEKDKRGQEAGKGPAWRNNISLQAPHPGQQHGSVFGKQ